MFASQVIQLCMIQRIQTIWLFLASVAIFALFLFPYLQYADLGGIGKALKVTGRYSGLDGREVLEEFFLLQTIATTLLGVFPIYIIFLFRNRKRQSLLTLLNAVLLLLFGAWLYASAIAALAESNQKLSASNIGLGFVLISISIIFLFMALGGIRKDEKLIQSADRLR